MSLWQFYAATGGYAKSKRPEDEAMTAEEAATLAAWVDEKPVWTRH